MLKFRKDFSKAFRTAYKSISQERAQRRKEKKKFREQNGHSWRLWLNIATFVLIVVVLIAARKQLVEAWHLVGQANLLILLLIIPAQFVSYYASTEIFFTYLRARGQMKNISTLQATTMSLEMNFVNHVFPSGGVSGVGYMNWRLGKIGISAGQSTMAQIMRYVIQLGTFLILLVIALIWATLEDRAASWIVVMVSISITVLVCAVFFGGYLIDSKERMESFARFLTNNVNKIVAKITFGRKTNVMQFSKVEIFFLDFHEDFLALKQDKKMLYKPIVWSFIFNIMDVSLFMIAFWSLGAFVNPAILLIAYGAAAVSGAFMLTPGGAGAYEAIMIGILTAGGVAAGTAFAGVILARAALILLTLVVGFAAYQYALHKYGQPNIEKIDATQKDRIKPIKKSENTTRILKLDETHELTEKINLPNSKSKVNKENNFESKKLSAAERDEKTRQILAEKYSKK